MQDALARLGFIAVAAALCILAYVLGSRRPRKDRVLYRFVTRPFGDVVAEDGRAVEAYEQYA